MRWFNRGKADTLATRVDIGRLIWPDEKSGICGSRLLVNPLVPGSG
jgi:hypothetical protein